MLVRRNLLRPQAIRPQMPENILVFELCSHSSHVSVAATWALVLSSLLLLQGLSSDVLTGTLVDWAESFVTGTKFAG
jgi:hypothetical protein